MSRDWTRFPADENGDALWNMHAQGDDLSRGREMNFSVVFPSEQQAVGFHSEILRAGHNVQLRRFLDQPDGLTWDITVSTPMVPSHLQVTQFEKFLADMASRYGGKNDGWGCFAQA